MFATIIVAFGVIALLSGALPQRTFTNKNSTAAGALADDCQLLRQNPFMVCIAFFFLNH